MKRSTLTLCLTLPPLAVLGVLAPSFVEATFAFAMLTAAAAIVWAGRYAEEQVEEFRAAMDARHPFRPRAFHGGHVEGYDHVIDD